MIQQGLEQGLKRGLEQGLRRSVVAVHQALFLLYETRFGPMSALLRAAVKRTLDPDTLTQWSELTARNDRAPVDRTIASASSASKPQHSQSARANVQRRWR